LNRKNMKKKWRVVEILSSRLLRLITFGEYLFKKTFGEWQLSIKR
jgi:hypothetical protein